MSISPKIPYSLALLVFHVLRSTLDVEGFQAPSFRNHNTSLTKITRKTDITDIHGNFSTFRSPSNLSTNTKSSSLLFSTNSDEKLSNTNEVDSIAKLDQDIYDSSSSEISSLNRRNALLNMLASSLLIGTTWGAVSPASAAEEGSTKQVRAKGAAEYDLEFYMQNLVKGNKREGNTQPSARPASLSFPPRTLHPFLQTIINDDLSDQCISIRTLSTITNTPANDIASEVALFREKVAKSFAVNSQWNENNMRDEYYFDLTAYALYRVAANLMPGPDQRMYQKRDEWVRLLGTEIYKEMKQQNLVTIEPKRRQSSSSPLTVTNTVPILQQILDTFSSYNFIESYRLGDKNDEYRSGTNVFDTYDDEDIAAGTSVNCLISLYRPTTLTSSLQIVGEGSRFIPEFVGTTIAAMWREEASLTVAYETYFVDGVYRPNPKDYFPNEQLLQYTIMKK